MKAATFSLLGVLSIVLAASSAWGASSPDVQLTPANIEEQPHRILIQTAASEGEVDFFVRVSKGIIPLEVEWGYLQVQQGQKSIARCRVHGESNEHGFNFEFSVAESLLEDSTFRFMAATETPAARENLPSGGGWLGYSISLRSFVFDPQAEKREFKALLEWLTEKGIEHREGPKSERGDPITRRILLGPDYEKKHTVGLAYLPPRTPGQIEEAFRNLALPLEMHGNWAIFQIGGPAGNGATEFVADYQRVLEALKAFAAAPRQLGKE